MVRLPGCCINVILILLICTTASAVFSLVDQAEATNQIVAFGEIELYCEDGSTRMTSYNFPQFSGGMPGVCSKWFYVRNVGKQPVQISWRLSESSIPWIMSTKQNWIGYDYYETNICKYTFGIHSNRSGEYLAPKEKSIFLDVEDEAKLCFELTYTGKPNTAELFSLTVSFCAIQG